MISIFRVSHILPTYIAKTTAKNEKRGKYWPFVCGKHAITNLSPTKYVPSVNSSFIKESKKKRYKKISFEINFD